MAAGEANTKRNQAPWQPSWRRAHKYLEGRARDGKFCEPHVAPTWQGGADQMAGCSEGASRGCGSSIPWGFEKRIPFHHHQIRKRCFRPFPQQPVPAGAPARTGQSLQGDATDTAVLGSTPQQKHCLSYNPQQEEGPDSWAGTPGEASVLDNSCRL